MYIVQQNWDSEALDDKFKVTADPHRGCNSALSWDFSHWDQSIGDSWWTPRTHPFLSRLLLKTHLTKHCGLRKSEPEFTIQTYGLP